MQHAKNRSRKVLMLGGLVAVMTLVGCATIPQRTGQTDTAIALVVENGGTSGHWADATTFLNSNLTADFLRLNTGVAFVPVPEGTETVVLKNFNISSPAMIGLPYQSAYLGFTFPRPAPGTILLIAKKFRYYVKSDFFHYEAVDLTDQEIDQLLTRWRAENRDKKAPLPWAGFEVIHPESRRLDRTN